MNNLFALYVLLLATLYCIVNALVIAQLLQRTLHLNRAGAFFATALATSGISQLVVLAFQALFFIYYCQLHALLSTFFRISAVCPSFDKAGMLLQDSVLMIIIFGLGAIIVQFMLLRDYYHLDDEKLLIIITASNIIACAIRYGALHILI